MDTQMLSNCFWTIQRQTLIWMADARSDDENTAFMLACQSGHKEVVQLLRDHFEYIDLNARNDDGWTAFTTACCNYVSLGTFQNKSRNLKV